MPIHSRFVVACVRLGLSCTAALAVTAALAAETSDRVKPVALRTYSTPNSIGIEWDVEGDANHNAACDVKYRKQGTEPWRPALHLFRIDCNNSYGDHKSDRPYNMLAGSILFLEPGTEYEVALTLADPDGGGQSQTVAIRTRAVPKLADGATTLHVAPGSGGGEGSREKPFQGLAAAQAAAQPGDVCLVHAGDYGEFSFDKPGEPGKYLAWVAAGDGEVVFRRAVISASHVWFQGLLFQAAADAGGGLKAAGRCRDVVVTRNRFHGCHYSITLSPGCEDWTITDNTIVGEKKDLDTSDISGEGVELNHTSGHVVAFNRISQVADGISYALRNCDLFGNDIRDVTDDGIEPDYGYANIRIWQNRIHRAVNHGISFQPQFCGPWYIVRNEIFTRRGTLKPNVADRFVLVHNTMVVESRYAQGSADLLMKSLSRNNLWILLHSWNEKEPSYAIWAANRRKRDSPYSMDYQPRADWRTDVDYDGFDWDDTPTPFWWAVEGERIERFRDLESFSQAVGIEQHGRHVRRQEIFEIQDIPAYVAEPFSEKRLTLRNGCRAIDAGQPLPNVCDDFDGAAPDLGAYELGRPLPHYGPRP